MNKKHTPRLVRLAIITAVTAILWVGFEVYRAATKEQPPTVPEEVIAPLDPSLDIEVLNTLPQRIQIEDSEIEDVEIANPQADSTSEESEEENEEQEEVIEEEVETTNESTESATIEEEEL